uniref:G protein-coupled receptor n=1 Tax=Ascaris lumbricoides TaxID=6252 RepID=A0A0M3I3Y1_ASCLU
MECNISADYGAIEHHSFNYQQIVSGLSAIIMMGVVIGGYVIVIITSKQIFSKLNKVRMSKKTKRLQKQLAILMISQALLPVICVVAPLAILFALVYSRINIGPYASFAAILFSWQPCPHALLPVICVVAPLAILFALVYSQINIGPYASFAAILFSWQPCPHVYITLCFVSPFRRRIRAIMHCRRIEASDLRTVTAIIPSTKSVGGQFEGLTPIK